MVKTGYALLIVATASTLLADQVTLKNGDRLTGAVAKMDGTKLTFKTELASEVSIDWSNVTDLTSKAKVYVGLKKGQVVEGELTLTPSGEEVQSAEAGQ